MTMKYHILGAALLLGAFPVLAQDMQQTGIATSDSGTGNQIIDTAVPNEPVVEQASNEIVPVSIPSLLFNYWEQTAIVEAKKSAASEGFKRTVTDDEIQRAMDEPLDKERVKPPPEEREIKLGGILFTTKDEWTIWLNGERVTPDALPEEIIDLRVYKHYIDMKWQDEYTRRLYPIRLRAHQRFNLDSRIFLPG